MRNFSPSSARRLALGILGWVCIIIASCSNFLSGGDFKEQLEGDISYAEAKECTLIVASNPAFGSFLSAGEKICKVKYNIEVQFTVNSGDYIFKGLEAVNSKENSVSMADYVEFAMLESDDKTGTYKIQVKLLKESNDILIRPSCILIPKVEEITPKLESSGCDQDTSVKVLFNKAMNPETFGEFSCISISSDGVPLDDYFDTPYFSEDKTALYIPPLCGNDSSKLLLSPDGASEYRNISVEVNFTGEEKDADGIAIDGNAAHKYKINKSYGNLKKVKITLESDENMGSFVGLLQIDCVVGYSVEIQFKVKKDSYVFKGLEASGEAENIAGKISFENQSESESEVQKVKVRVAEDCGDITLKPKCLLLPKISEITPKYESSGCDQDSTIVIKFNKELNPNTFGDFSCLSIKLADGTDLRNSGYFETPFFSDDKTTLFIPTVKGKIIIDENSASEYADIIVSLACTNLKDSDGLSLSQGEEHKYRVNKNVDNVAPKFESLRIAKTKEDAVNGTNLITFEEFTNYASGSTASDGVSNHHVKSVWIYVKATDEGSGISAFTVKEKNIRTKEAAEISLPTLYQTQFQNESGSLNFESLFEYTFKGFDDGVVNLAFSVNDMSGNNTDFDKSSDLIKDTNCPVCLLGVDTDIKISSSKNVTYNIALAQPDSFGDAVKTDFITDMAGNVYKKSLTVTDDDEYTEKLTLVSAEYSYDNENFTSIPMENITFKYGAINSGLLDFTGNIAYIQFTADKTKDVYFRVTEKDSVGNTGTEVIFYNKALNIVACKKDSDKLTFTLDSALTDTSGKNVGIAELSKQCIPVVSLYVEYTGPDGNIQRTESLSDNLASGQSSTVEFKQIKIAGETYKISELPEGTYKFYCVASTGFYVLLWILPLNSSYCGEPFTFDTSQTVSIAAPKDSDLPANFSITPDTPVLNSGKRTVNVKLLFSSSRNRIRNPNFTYLVHYYHAETSKAKAYDGYATVPDSQNSIEFSLPCHYCSWNFEVVVINKNGEKKTLTKAPVDLSYDTVSPTITSGYNALYSSSNTIVFKTDMFKDEGDGLYTDANGMVPVRYLYSYTGATLGEIKIDWDSPEIMTTYYKSGDNYCEFPFDGNSGKYLYIQIRDKNGNTGEQIYTAPECAGKGSLTYSGSSFKFSCPNTLSKTQMELTTQYVSGGKWVNTDNIPSFYGYISMTRSDNGTSFSVTPTFTSTEKESFVRLLAHSLQYACYYPIYIYPEKYTTSNFSCKLKGHTQGSLGPVIYADKPVLVHTFYCSKNLGNSAEEWLYNGIETGIVQESSTFTYTSDNLSAIPAGKYYTTVIHYADGMIEMTDVKQK